MCESVDNDSARGYYTTVSTGATPYLFASSRQLVGKPSVVGGFGILLIAFILLDYFDYSLKKLSKL